MKNRKLQTGPSLKACYQKAPRTARSKAQNLGICKICFLAFDTSQSTDKTQCNLCYNALFYYLYINMHMFVQQDQSFKEIYFQSPHKRQFNAQKLSQERDSGSEGLSEDIKMDWIDNLLSDS